jgi:hypothetical protein
MFRVKTQANASVYLDLNGERIHTKTLDDGYFKFSIPLQKEFGYGWMEYRVSLIHNGEEIFSKGSFIRPFEGTLGFISDIDDTFLVSHTRNPFKKLYILLFRNLKDRKIFEDVVPHYQALPPDATTKTNRMLFYVSSSEWNLYRFIIDFTELHDLPRAVLLLKDIKTSLTDFFLTGRGDHNHKFEKIKHILEFIRTLPILCLATTRSRPFFIRKHLQNIPGQCKGGLHTTDRKLKEGKGNRSLAKYGIDECKDLLFQTQHRGDCAFEVDRVDLILSLSR